MRALLLQLDGKLPNLALMRIAAHHRALGDAVTLRRAGNPAAVEPQMGDQFDRVYASLIFTRSRPLGERVRRAWPGALLGGTGWRLDSSLAAAGIDPAGPVDYADYPGFAPSLGFTQRGCRLRCSFCVVPAKEGAVKPAADIFDIWRGAPHPRHLVLLDNDFFGQARDLWQRHITDMRLGGFKVCFSQGINVRALDPEQAAQLANVDYRAGNFKERRLYCAWDNFGDGRRLFRGLKLLFAAGVRPSQVMVYMLIGYWPGEDLAAADRRRQALRALGVVPYPMPYVRTPELVGYQRWVIGAYDKSIAWPAWQAAGYRPEGLGANNQAGFEYGLRRVSNAG